MGQSTDKRSRAEQTADELSTLIFDGVEFQPGDRLPNEIELANRFHVSRTTLREAIRTLTVRGMVEVRHGIGTFVSTQLPAPSDYGLHDLANLKVDARDLYEARLIFEPHVAALAVKRATEREMKMILEMEKEIELAYRRGEDISELDRRFHNTLVKCAHNPFLEQIITIINDAINNMSCIIDFSLVQDMVANDHQYIMNFIKKRDSVGAESAMKVHILHCMELLDMPNHKTVHSEQRAFM